MSNMTSYESSASHQTTFNLSLDGNGTLTVEAMLMPYGLAHLLSTSIVLGTLILATIIGNVFVIAAIVLERNLQNAANYLIVSLAVADLMVAALVMPLAAVDEVSTQWFLGGEICDMWVVLDVMCCTSSIWHLVAIAMDRYWAVTHVDYIRNRSQKRILIMIALSWLVSAGISIPPLFGWRDHESNDPVQSGECLISQDYGYTIFSTMGAFYVPLLVMIIIYIRIFQAAKKTIRKKNIKAHARPHATPLLHHAEETSMALTQVKASPNNSPEVSTTNGSLLQLNDDNKNNCKDTSPPSSPQSKLPNGNSNNSHRNSFLDISKQYLKGQNSSPRRSKERQREKIEHKRERKAARTLAIITGTFVCCWLPFFIIALVRPFCGAKCEYPDVLMSIIVWSGYLNSLLNPIIYTIFNPDFRMAFRKILFGKYHHRR